MKDRAFFVCVFYECEYKIAKIILFIVHLIVHPDKKISIWLFHQMLVCQKYGGVAEIRTRASLATPNDLANRPLQPA